MDENIPQISELIQDISWHFTNLKLYGEYFEDISLVEYMTLKKLDEIKNITMQDLGALLNITKSGISKIINRLEKKSYVVKAKSPVDGRICCVLLTDEGKKILKKFSHQHYKYMIDILEDIDEKSLQNIKDSLEILIKVVQENDENIVKGKVLKNNRDICCTY